MFGNLGKRLFGGKQSSNQVAKSRLSFVLVQDRAGLSPEEMASFRTELTDVIERYFVVDRDKFNIAYEREDDSTSLVINSPVLVRRERTRPASKNSKNPSAASKNGKVASKKAEAKSDEKKVANSSASAS